MKVLSDNNTSVYGINMNQIILKRAIKLYVKYGLNLFGLLLLISEENGGRQRARKIRREGLGIDAE